MVGKFSLVVIAALLAWHVSVLSAQGVRRHSAPQTPPATTKLDPSQFVATNLRGNPDALAAARFCLGHLNRDFNVVASVVQAFVEYERRLLRELPGAVAQKRFEETLQNARTVFNSQPGLFPQVAGFFVQGARIFVTDVRPQRDSSGSFSKVFVQIEYTNRASAPRSRFQSPKPIRKTMFAIPVVSGMVMTSPASGPMTNLGMPIERISDVDEFWETPDKDNLLRQSKTPTQQLGRIVASSMITVPDSQAHKPVLISVYDTELSIDKKIQTNPWDTNGSTVSLRKTGPVQDGFSAIWIGDIIEMNYSPSNWPPDSITINFLTRTGNSQIILYFGSGPLDPLSKDKARRNAVSSEAHKQLTAAVTSWRGKYQKVVEENPKDPILLNWSPPTQK